MSMYEWAKREVEIACENERKNSKEGEWEYGCACYESALKAYKSLCDDGHSGMSFGFAKQILIRLMDGNPLTSIEDTDDVWNHTHDEAEGTVKSKSYQCKRKSSLFKKVYPDGMVKYHDNDAYYCIDVHTGSTYTNGFIERTIVEPMYPITFPYVPSKPVKVYCEDFLTDPKNGDFDTMGILYIKKPDGEVMQVGRYFKASENGWVEIDADAYEKRRMIAENNYE